MNLNEINKIFEQFDNEENQIYMNSMSGKYNEVSSCNFGIITCKFIEKDKIILGKLIPKIKGLIEDKSFQNGIVELEKNKAKEELKAIKNKLTTTKYNEEEKKNALIWYSVIIKRCIDKIENLNFNKFLLNCNDTSGVFEGMQNIKNDLKFYKENYKYICIADILFEEYKRDKARKDRFAIPINNTLEKLYKENNIDLNKIDKQYDKYKLLTIDNNFEITISNIPKVYDKRFDVYLYINEIQEDFLQLLKKLQEQKYIVNLALRPEYIDVSKNLQDLSIILEEKEFGDIFSFENLGNPTITKLYSTDKYDNKLWIIIDEENITFEELLENFDIHNNFIVTQVIHLQYKQKKNNYIIHHIDHEYIFYTEDKYMERENNPMQKGEAKTRYKTFKIDNSKIPFTLDDGSFFLYKVLDTYFKNKDLIKEYFENVLKK